MNINDFLTALVKEKHADAVLEDYQLADMVGSLSERLTKFIILAVLTEFATKNQALLAQFQTLAKDNTDPTKIQTFVEEHIPDGSAFLAKTLTDFRELYLANLPN